MDWCGVVRGEGDGVAVVVGSCGVVRWLEAEYGEEWRQEGEGRYG